MEYYFFSRDCYYWKYPRSYNSEMVFIDVIREPFETYGNDGAGGNSDGMTEVLSVVLFISVNIFI